MRTHSLIIAGAVLTLALGGPPAARGQVPYSFTRIAITGTGSPYSQLFAPSLNATNTVSFGATLTTGFQRISTGNGTTTTVVAESGPASTSVYNRFNASGVPTIFTAIQPSSTQVAFYAGFNDGTIGIVRSNGPSTVLIANTGTGSPFIDFSLSPNINSGGVVSFVGVAGTADQRVLTGSGGVLTPIAHTGTNVPAFNAFTGINNIGFVSFTAAVNGGQQLFVGNGTTTTPIASTGTTIATFVGPSALNNSNQVAFVANRTAVAGGGQAVYLGAGAGLTQIAGTGAGSAYMNFGNYVDLTSGGAVVFAANLVGGGQGIFTGPDPVANRIVRTGGALDGSTVQSVVLFPSSVNDLGRVAFLAGLADGRVGVYLAIPVPEPTGALAAALAALGLAGAVRRCRARRRSPDMDRMNPCRL
jgi:hypothetical protein